MDFALSPRTLELSEAVEAFMDAHIYPNEALLHSQIEAASSASTHPRSSRKLGFDVSPRDTCPSSARDPDARRVRLLDR